MRKDALRFEIGGVTSYRTLLHSTKLFGGTVARVVKGSDWSLFFKEHEWQQKNEGVKSCLEYEFAHEQYEYPESCDFGVDVMYPEDEYADFLKKKRAPYKTEHSLNKRNVFAKAMAYASLEKCSKFLAFYSISFPFGTSDKSAVEIFNICRTRLKRDCGLDSWLRVCERQKNGTIHFHLLTCCYMDVRYVNSVFGTAIRNKLDYTGDYNGVDVEGVTSRRRLSGRKSSGRARSVCRYLVKYLSKENETTFSVSPYSCSRDVSALATSMNVYETQDNRKLISEMLDYSEGGAADCKVFSSDFAVRYSWPRLFNFRTGELFNTTYWDKMIYKKILEKFNNLIVKCRDTLTVLSSVLAELSLNIETFRALVGSCTISCQGWALR